ncbi:GGDEF domain-containing protein [Methylobacterium trifolii]|nr:sensor domain-containing diguanylate cyclase [Methylobacterium trifolii]
MRVATGHLRRDRASRLIASIGLSVTVCLILLGIYLIRDLRDGAWRQAERNAENLLALIEEGVGRNVRMYDLSLRAAAEGASRADIAALDPELQHLVLFDRAATASGLGMIAVTDAAGRVRLASDPVFPVGSSLADHPEFRTLEGDPGAGLVVSDARLSRLTGWPVMPMARRITNPDGSFGGIVSGAIRLDYFQRLFSRLRISDGISVNLFHADGTLLAKQPAAPGDMGRSIAAGETYRRFRASERGLLVGTSHLDGQRRLYAFANIEGLPLIVDVAVSVESIDAAWMSKAALIACLILGLSGITFWLTLLLQREIALRAAAESSSRAANAELSLLASTDSLTGLPNRRRYDEVIAGTWREAAKTGVPLALLLIDADHFKQFNDHFGHHRGDGVLKAIAGCLHLDRPGAIACRIGGEEFAVILPGLQAMEARVVAEQVRRAVVLLQIPHAPEMGGVATVSIGVGHAHPSGDDCFEPLFAAADAALYEAKRSGRNRVRIAGEALQNAQAGSPGAEVGRSMKARREYRRA